MKKGDITRVKLRSIRPLKAAASVGLISLVLGFISGIAGAINWVILQSLFSSFAEETAGADAMAKIVIEPIITGIIGSMASISTWFFIIVYPITAFIMGFCGAFLISLIYNMLAKFIGIEFDLEEKI